MESSSNLSLALAGAVHVASQGAVAQHWCPVTQVAVHDLCLGVPPGERFGLLGPNGAGKNPCSCHLTPLIMQSASHPLQAVTALPYFNSPHKAVPVARFQDIQLQYPSYNCCTPVQSVRD